MVLVPAGTYVIGRNDGDPIEVPQHTVKLDAFFIDRTEVTNAQYLKFIDTTSRRPPAEWKGGAPKSGQGNLPVTGVSWQDAADYAAWVGKRLPTEAEWEAAARGSEGRRYPWGQEWKPGVTNIGTKAIGEVGQLKEGASPFGVLDLIGNVWEWTADEFALYPGNSGPKPANLKPELIYRVIRGGAYDGDERHDAAYRGYVDASRGYDRTGFRCAKTAPQSGQ
jgi:formylglycine-generating enzyme required for sulfatase activity